MAEKKKDHKKKHLHEQRVTETHDGKYLHHHTYKKHRDDDESEPERQNVAVSNTPEEAGQHVADQFGQNEPPPDPAAAAPAEGDPNAAPAPDPNAAPAGQ